jgi:uncharacterized protein
MPRDFYAYAARYGCQQLSWERFGELTAVLGEQLATADVELIVGVSRAGLFPATAVACALQLPLYPVVFERGEPPVWRVDLPASAVAGKRVAIVDEVADSGRTLQLVARRAADCGAKMTRTAALVSHSWAAPRPACVAWETDAFVIFPWEARVYSDGRWQPHPEIAACL